jgi:hypothetical protein
VLVLETNKADESQDDHKQGHGQKSPTKPFAVVDKKGPGGSN